MPDTSNFTERAKKVILLAEDEARRLNHNYIGSEHLLAALVRERDGVAGRILSHMGVTLPKVHTAIELLIGRGQTLVIENIGWSRQTTELIGLAADEARRFHHHYIGTEHLLLAIVRKGDGIAVAILESLDIKLDEIRSQVVAIITQAPSYTSTIQTQASASKEDEEKATE